MIRNNARRCERLPAIGLTFLPFPLRSLRTCHDLPFPSLQGALSCATLARWLSVCKGLATATRRNVRCSRSSRMFSPRPFLSFMPFPSSVKMSFVKTSLAPPALLALLLLAAAPQARGQAQIELGPRVGYEIDQLNAFALGGDVRVSTAALPVQLNGSVDYFFLDDASFSDNAGNSVEASQNLLKFAVNGLFQFGIDNQYFTPYAGPGLSITRYSVDSDADIDGQGMDLGSGSETDVGLNAVGGAEFGVGGLRPFVQAEFVLLGDYEPVQFTAGLLFDVGGS
ncbi:MAG: hypothetical protein BRD44_07995 [Bacteroidetes bacterium QS_7_67_15]|nr:MAG: hypothetical protein BRD44_07995 [Bacteroidetes bacterium QS_7_67_15]